MSTRLERTGQGFLPTGLLSYKRGIISLVSESDYEDFVFSENFGGSRARSPLVRYAENKRRAEQYGSYTLVRPDSGNGVREKVSFLVFSAEIESEMRRVMGNAEQMLNHKNCYCSGDYEE